MQLNIFKKQEEKTPSDIQEEKELFFKLEKDRHGQIELNAVDKNGNMIGGSHILTIRTDGKIHLHHFINKGTGLSLSESRFVNISNINHVADDQLKDTEPKSSDTEKKQEECKHCGEVHSFPPFLEKLFGISR